MHVDCILLVYKLYILQGMMQQLMSLSFPKQNLVNLRALPGVSNGF